MTDRCVDGRVFRHRPYPDDPDFEHDVGPCPNLTGERCSRGDCPEPAGAGDIEDLPPLPPLPFCRTPERCAGKGYCPREIACNE